MDFAGSDPAVSCAQKVRKDWKHLPPHPPYPPPVNWHIAANSSVLYPESPLSICWCTYLPLNV